MQQKDSKISPSSLLQKKMLKDESEPTWTISINIHFYPENLSDIWNVIQSLKVWDLW